MDDLAVDHMGHELVYWIGENMKVRDKSKSDSKIVRTMNMLKRLQGEPFCEVDVHDLVSKIAEIFYFTQEDIDKYLNEEP